jgi:hypothetical protein
MSKPSKQQLESALAAAQRMRAEGADQDHLAHAFLYLQRRDELLERVLQAVEHYLHSGHGSQEHARLLKALDAARQQDWQEDLTERDRHGTFGLD